MTFQGFFVAFDLQRKENLQEADVGKQLFKWKRKSEEEEEATTTTGDIASLDPP